MIVLSRPTTDQVLVSIADELQSTVAPAVTNEVANVLLGQVDQTLRKLARRAAHEIGWMIEETAAIDAALGREADLVESYHLNEVIERYSAASDALGDAIEAAFDAGDRARISELKALLMQRVANEQEILGQLDLVGRG